MAWPTLGGGGTQAGTVATGIIGTGDATYMRWGTKSTVTYTGKATIGATGTVVSAFLVVTRINERLKKEDFQYDNGDGLQTGRIQLFHGVTWDVTVRDHVNMGTPLVGTYVQIVDMAGYVGTIGVTYGAYVMESTYDAAPKQPGERVISVERIALIEGWSANL